MVAVLLRMTAPPLQLVRVTTAAARVAPPNVPPPPVPPPASSNINNNAVNRRQGLVGAFALSLSPSQLSGHDAWAAILEADDDVELLERVKKDRKKRLERQGIITSSNQETSYLQEVVYKLTKVGQAIESNDLPAASTLLGSTTTNATWLINVNTAFAKLSAGPEEKDEIDTFNSSLASLYTAVGNRDIESSKSAFVSSAGALEKWIGLTGLNFQIKGL